MNFNCFLILILCTTYLWTWICQHNPEASLTRCHSWITIHKCSHQSQRINHWLQLCLK